MSSELLHGEVAIIQGVVSIGMIQCLWPVKARCGTSLIFSLGTPFFAVAIVLSQRERLARASVAQWFIILFFLCVPDVCRDGCVQSSVPGVCGNLCSLSRGLYHELAKSREISRLPSQVSARFPRQLFVGFAYFLSGALLLLWLGRIVPMMVTGHFPAELAGMTTLETQALDLGMVVPLAISAGILLEA
ncbi:MAG: hypothetical protein U0V70_12245 [Terriglobia bacterium]